MRKKFVVMDLDGTLLSDKKEIDKETLDYLTKLMDSGHVVAFASGRRIENARNYAKQLFFEHPDKGYIICCDGCYIYDGNGNILRTSPLLSGEDLQYIYAVAKGEMCNFRFYSLEADYAIYDRKSLLKSTVKKLLTGNRRTGRIAHSVNTNSLTSFKDIEKVVLEKPNGFFSDNCCERLREKFNFHKMSCHRLEIQQKGVNKAYAVNYLLRVNGFYWDDVLFFGDDANDHCMLDTGCTVVAMGNADEIMTQKASYITLSNNEQGVLKALRLLNVI